MNDLSTLNINIDTNIIYIYIYIYDNYINIIPEPTHILNGQWFSI